MTLHFAGVSKARYPNGLQRCVASRIVETTMRSGSLRTLTIYLTTTTIALIAPAVPPAAGDCAPGTTCLSVQENGAPGPGPSTAQCSGRFPDFVVPTTMAPSAGPWFKL